jgi:rhomboid protease GluP
VNQETDDPQLPRPFRVCTNCRALTPTGSPHCTSCGALSIEVLVEQQQVRAERRFVTALIERPVVVTYAILVVNLLVYLLMVGVAGGSHFNNLLYMNDIGTLIAFGAKTNQLLREGEFFRLVTPVFIHGGLLHLASNSYAIWTIGPLVEKLYGPARFFLIYLLAGIGGVGGSYFGGLSRAPNIPGVGASGAIFGLFGVLLIFGYRYREELPAGFRQSIRSGILPVILINLVIGFSIPSIDNAAHIGGLLTGALLVFVVPYLAPGRRRDSMAGIGLLLLGVAITLGAFGRAWQTRTPHLHQRVSAVTQFLDSLEVADDSLTAIFRQHTTPSGPLDAATGSEAATERLRVAVGELERHPAPDAEAERCRQRMLGAVRDLQQLLNQPASGEQEAAWAAIGREVLQARQEKLDWVRHEGARYGFRIATPPPGKEGRE